jgi:hypothetical protein
MPSPQNYEFLRLVEILPHAYIIPPAEMGTKEKKGSSTQEVKNGTVPLTVLHQSSSQVTQVTFLLHYAHKP